MPNHPDKPTSDNLSLAERVMRDMEAEGAGTAVDEVDGGGFLEGAAGTGRNIVLGAGAGITEAAFQTKDFVFGTTHEADKSWLRQRHEAARAQLQGESAAFGITGAIAQFVTGLAGAGRIQAGAKAVSATARAASQAIQRRGLPTRAAVESARAGAVAQVVFDPYEERLSNFVEAFPDLSNPITSYLAADPEDTRAEARFKVALEGILLDAALVGVLVPAIRAVRRFRSGDSAGAEAAAQEADSALARRVVEAEEVAGGASTPDLPTPLSSPSRPTPGASTDRPILRDPAPNDPFRAQAEESGETALYVFSGDDHLANLQVRVDGDTLHIENVFTATEFGAEAFNTLGTRTVREVVRQLTERFPGARFMAGERVGGARFGGEHVGEGGVPVRLPLRRPDAPDTGTPTAPTAAAQRPAPRPVSVEEAGVVAIQRDVDAIIAHGSRGRAAAAGHQFARGDRIPWQKLNTGDDLAAFVARASDATREQLDSLKGGAVLADARVNAIVNRRVAAWNEDPSDVWGALRRSGDGAKRLAADMEAADALAIKMADDAYQVAADIARGDFVRYGGDPALARAEMAKRTGMAMSLMGASRSMLSNAGRTLRRARGDVPRLSQDEIRRIESLDPEALARLLNDTGGDLGQLKALLSRPSRLMRTNRFASWLLVNNLLWGFDSTHVINTGGNLYMLATRPGERIIGSFFLAGPGASAMRREAVREYRYTFTAAMDAIGEASRTIVRGNSKAFPFQAEIHQVQAFGRNWTPATDPDLLQKFVPIRNIGDVAHNAIAFAHMAVGTPTRLLGAADDLVKQTRYRSMVLARASLKADEMGLQGQDYQRFLRRELDNAFDESGRAVDARAAEEARVVTFQDDLTFEALGGGKPVSAYLNIMKQDVPGFVTILPFVKTIANVLRYGVKLTPGLNLLQTEYRRALSGARGQEAQAHAIGQMSLGFLYLTAGALLAREGVIIGDFPSDPSKRRELMAKGARPNSIRTRNEDGTDTYFALHRFDPIALPFLAAANILDIYQHPEKREAADMASMALLLAVSEQVTDRAFLISLNRFLQAATDPNRHAEMFVGRTAANFIPGASLMRRVNPDPHLRDARSMVDNLLATIPGWSDGLPAQYDAFGDPVLARKGLTSSTTDDLVDNEWIRMGLEGGDAISMPTRPSALVRGVDLRDVRMDDGRNAYVAYQEFAGHPPGAPSLKDALASTIQTDAYQQLPDGDIATMGTRQWALSGIIAKYREAAAQFVWANSDEFRDAAVEERLRVGAHIEAQREEALGRLGDAYGVDLRSIIQPPAGAAATD